jgi:RimJ/RimL family protein N-acetyltransferase
VHNEDMPDGLSIAAASALPRRPIRSPHSGHWVTLEPLSPAHLPALAPLAVTIPESWRWLPYGPFTDERAFAAYVRFAASSDGELVWAVRPRLTRGEIGPAVGWLALLDAQVGHRAIELGNVWFPPGLAQTPAATEACMLLLRHVFDHLGYRRVAWKCDADHAASRRAAERLGFRLEGIARAHMIVRGGRRDTSYYSMLDSEWPARRHALATWLDPSNFNAHGRQITSLDRA